jgi:hypothetical protein
MLKANEVCLRDENTTTDCNCEGNSRASCFHLVIKNSPSGRTLNGIEVKHIPSACEIIETCDNQPSKKSREIGCSTSFDLWREEREQKRVMGALL